MVRSLILTLAKIILPILVLGIVHLKCFYGNFLCLKVFEFKLKLSCYNLFFWPMANRKWSKHVFHWYMVCHALERHGGAIWGKTWVETL